MKLRTSLIFQTLVGVVARTAVVFSLFLLFRGHNAPGGGFAGGLVAGAALILLFVESGSEAVPTYLRADPVGVMAAGLAIAVATGALGWAWGPEFLSPAELGIPLGPLGAVKATAALPFDVGVYLVVVGMIGTVVDTLGRELD